LPEDAFTSQDLGTGRVMTVDADDLIALRNQHLSQVRLDRSATN